MQSILLFRIGHQFKNKGKKRKQKNPSEIPHYKNITPATELKSQVLSKYEYEKSMK